MLFLVRAFLTHSNIFRVLSPSQRNSIPLRKCAVVCVSRHPTLHFHNRLLSMYSHYWIMTILSKAKSFVFFKYLFGYSAIFTFSFFAQTAMTSRLFRLVRAKAPEVLISQEEKLMWNISRNKSSCFISFFLSSFATLKTIYYRDLFLKRFKRVLVLRNINVQGDR